MISIHTMASVRTIFKRSLCTSRRQIPDFGVLFDIDGVIMRGKETLRIFMKYFIFKVIVLKACGQVVMYERRFLHSTGIMIE